MKIKRILSILLALMMLLSLCACSSEEIELATDIVEALVNDPAPEHTPEEADVLPESEAQEPVTTPDREAEPGSQPEEEPEEIPAIDEYGSYTTKEDVALYLYTYGHLPENFITKSEARELGWEGGGLERYAPGYCIGGDRFGNREGLLPKASGRQYYECDINTLGASSRGAERIVFSNDGLIYYTGDHYESFELLYGEE